MITLSTTWMTPLLAGISVFTTFASPAFYLPAFTFDRKLFAVYRFGVGRGDLGGHDLTGNYVVGKDGFEVVPCSPA